MQEFCFQHKQNANCQYAMFSCLSLIRLNVSYTKSPEKFFSPEGSLPYFGHNCVERYLLFLWLILLVLFYLFFDLQVMDNMRRVRDLNELKCNVNQPLLSLLFLSKISSSCSSSVQRGRWKFSRNENCLL